MKSRLQITSFMLLFALVLSAFPALALPTSASAAVCYQAQFVADVTVPDGTTYTSETAFKKTWRLKNIGTCTWNTNDVTMIFDSGSQMGAPASVPMPSAVAPGATVDISVDMKAPSGAGHYIGYWKFKSSQGTVFGIGVNANRAWWVEINVPSNNNGSVAYDFAANAEKATWTSGAGGLTFPGTDGDAKGFALRKDKPKFESGVEATQPGLLFAPQNITNGFIQAEYPALKVDASDVFQTTVGCEAGATSCYVAYRLDYKVAGVVKTYWTFRERFEGLTYTANINLAPLAGKDVSFILYISSYGSPAGDRALWGNPVILRRGIVPPPPVTVTGTPPTPTATRTPAPITATVPPSACDKVQFISDVNIPDGSTLQPGANFTKTWRLKNVGTCAWSTSYQLVYFSGEKMNGPSSAAFPKAVAVGETVDISVNLTAPSAAGSYRGYWMFKNANGALFGLGAQGNKPWWVDIKVAGPTVTPGGVTATPSVTSTPGTPTVTATSASATSAPTGYQNTKYNFKFALPSGATIANQSDNDGRVNLPVSSGTNLQEKYVAVTVRENLSPCVSPIVGGNAGTPENVTFNNIQFTKLTGTEGAAGNVYDWVTYSTVRNNACISLAFILRSVNPNVLPTPPAQFDKNAESAVFTTVMNSFNWIIP